MARKPKQPAGLPLSRPVVVATLPASGTTMVIEPDLAEREALAKALGLAAIDQLRAVLTLTPGARETWRVSGDIAARIQPICVVSLDPFEQVLGTNVEIVFAPEEPDRELGEDDPPDAIVDGVIDMGVVTAEFLALALDPYPRKPGAVFAYSDPAAAELSPFAALKALGEPPKQ